MRPIDEYRRAWRLWSVRLAAAAGVLAAGLTAAPGLLTWLVNEFLPHGPWRMAASAAIGIGIVVFVIPTAVRLMRQPGAERPDGN